jgi:lactate permease
MGKDFSLVGISVGVFVIFLLLTTLVWKIVPFYFFISLEKGFRVALDIFFVIFGAVFFIEIISKEKIIQSISFYLEAFSKDIRIQVIFLAWFFENLIEGVAGFGTPPAVVVPLLLGLGLTPINAIAISLLGNSMAGAFGAAGTPIRVGFVGLATPGVVYYTAMFNFVGILVPAFILWILSVGRKDRVVFFREGLPFALWSGFVFWLFSFFASFFGGEFPTIVGSLLGLFIAILTARLKIFIPKTVRCVKDRVILRPYRSLAMVVFPYVVVVFLLAMGKLMHGGFNPGFALFVSGLVVFIINRRRFIEMIPDAFKKALLRTKEPFVVIFAMSATVQLILNSGFNFSETPSMLRTISTGFENPLLPFFAPFAGAFGAFVSGSVTVSNILFGTFLNSASLIMQIDPAKILGLQAVGAAAGNMVALADVMTACAIAKVYNKEKEILKIVVIPCIIYVTLAGLVGMILIR